MDPVVDGVLLVLTVGGGATVLSNHVWKLLSRRRLPVVECALACPRTGGTVRCKLAIHEKSGHIVEARQCSRLGPGRPTCAQDCVHLMNLGIPLWPTDPEADASG